MIQHAPLPGLENFIARIQFLFDHGGCYASGYTKYMLKLLGKARIVFIDGEPKSIGGPRRPCDGVKKRCLGRMKNWVFLVKMTVEAEFPDVDKLMSFEVLDLSKDARTEHCPGEDHDEYESQMDKCFNMIALMCKVDVEILREDFFFLFRVVCG